jgi:hypothetical protein
VTVRALLLFWLALPLAAANPAARIRAFLDASPVARTSFWGVRIFDLARNRVLFERNADRLFLPASETPPGSDQPSVHSRHREWARKPSSPLYITLERLAVCYL